MPVEWYCIINNLLKTPIVFGLRNIDLKITAGVALK